MNVPGACGLKKTGSLFQNLIAMTQKQIRIVRSSAVPVKAENIDTDQIIPARFLKATDRTGFGENLFRDWRYYNDDPSQPTDFPLNDNRYSGRILVAGKNFGCGSSREHAAWAIKDAGFDVVISSFFADIFKTNALNNFLLPLTVDERFLEEIFQAIEKHPATLLEVNLPKQTLDLIAASGTRTCHLEIDAYKKSCLINGQDDIDYLYSLMPAIEAYEQSLETR